MFCFLDTTCSFPKRVGPQQKLLPLVCPRLDSIKALLDSASPGQQPLVRRIWNEKKLPYSSFFPCDSLFSPQELEPDHDEEGVHLNEGQLDALASVRNEGFSVIQAPPGTGKTYTIARLIKQLLRKASGSILVCATSNEAVRMLAKAHQKFQNGRYPTTAVLLTEYALHGTSSPNDALTYIKPQSLINHNRSGPLLLTTATATINNRYWCPGSSSQRNC